jgi:N-methylhydantoinase A
MPGPACYGRGGREATVTDANLILGRSPASLGGEVLLDAALAEAAIRSRIAGPLGMPVLEAADGIVELLNHNMAAAIRAVSVERGHDPRGFVLVAGGGGGGLHAGRLAELLGIPRVIVPASAGLLSTLGLLATDLKSDFVQTTVPRGGQFDILQIRAVLQSLEQRAARWLSDEGVAPDDRTIVRSAGLRYVNQAYEITVLIDDAPGESKAALEADDLARIQARFREHHERLYGWSSPGLPIELVNLGVTAQGRLPKLAASALASPSGSDRHAADGRRKVYFGREHGMLDTPVYACAALAPGRVVDGPAVIEQRFSTILVLPGHRAALDARGNVSIEVLR